MGPDKYFYETRAERYRRHHFKVWRPTMVRRLPVPWYGPQKKFRVHYALQSYLTVDYILLLTRKFRSHTDVLVFLMTRRSRFGSVYHSLR
jgi:hypothetical protein